MKSIERASKEDIVEDIGDISSEDSKKIRMPIKLDKKNINNINTNFNNFDPVMSKSSKPEVIEKYKHIETKKNGIKPLW